MKKLIGMLLAASILTTSMLGGMGAGAQGVTAVDISDGIILE